ncbi:hypothetical protein Tco_0039186 [Tanacetum coccineum]
MVDSFQSPPIEPKTQAPFANDVRGIRADFDAIGEIEDVWTRQSINGFTTPEFHHEKVLSNRGNDWACQVAERIEVRPLGSNQEVRRFAVGS